MGQAYERAWRTASTELLAQLFAPEATYQTAPFEEPFRGLPAIAAMWEPGRAGSDEVFTMHSEVVAVDGDTGVVRVEVRYGDPVEQHYRDLWVLCFDGAAAVLPSRSGRFGLRAPRAAGTRDQSQPTPDPDRPRCVATRSGSSATVGGADRRSALDRGPPMNQSCELRHTARPLHSPRGFTHI